MTSGYLLRMGKLESTDRDFLDSLVRGLKSTGGRPESSGGLAMDDQLAVKLKDAYETISKLEVRTHHLIEIIISLRNTYEFFEIQNDISVVGL